MTKEEALNGTGASSVELDVGGEGEEVGGEG